MAYSDAHRAFLQSLMARPYIDATEAKEIIALIKTKEKAENGEESTFEAEQISNQEISSFIAKVDHAINPYNLSIMTMADQRKGKRVWALVNQADDDIIRLATSHSADEIAFFKRIIDAIFDTYNTREAEVCAIKGIQALALNKNPQPDAPANADNDEARGDEAATQQSATQVIGIGPGLTKKEAEETLEKFIDEGWLNKTTKGYYYLTSRALMELELYLIRTYNTSNEGEGLRIKHCDACKEILTMGYRCDNLDCGFRIHEHCTETFFRSRDKACPKCKTEFSEQKFVGPKAGKDLPAASARRKRASNVSARSQHRTPSAERDAGVEEEEEGGEEGEEDAEEGGATQGNKSSAGEEDDDAD